MKKSIVFFSIVIIIIISSSIFSSKTIQIQTFQNKYELNERELLEQLNKKASGTYLVADYMPIKEAKVFQYEFYAKYPQITLYYSPRMHMVGYVHDSKVCVGYNAQFISESSKKYQELCEATEPFIQSIKDKSDKEKARLTEEWIRIRCNYTLTPENMWDECLYGCLVQGSATCLGYSQGYYYMMKRLHVPCRIVINERHAWNEVFIDNQWVTVDLTK